MQLPLERFGWHVATAGFCDAGTSGELDRSSDNVATTCCVPESWVHIARHYPSLWNYVEVHPDILPYIIHTY
jgi:hypothetical protein